MDAQLKNEILELIKRVLGTFTLQYTKQYTLALIRLIEIQANQKPSPFLLEERPPWKEDYKQGYLIKEGGFRKSWKKRWFVVRPNYSVDYYESEEASKNPKAKKKGSMNLCGYRVIEDPNQGILLRLKKLAEKMGMNFDDLPKPKEYPPLTFEVHHWRRRPYFIQAANQEEFNDWVAQFKTCCWRAYGLTKDEFCHKQAFPEAVRKTRWELGRWGWYSGYGSEEQILSDLISDELEYDIMGRIYGKISGPWIVRNTIRNQVMKTIDGMVISAVRPAWAAMDKAVEELRPKIEPKIRELVEPLFKAKVELMEKIRAACMSVIDPILQEHVCPHLAKIMEVVKSPMVEGFNECYRLYDEHIGKWPGGEGDLKRSFRDLDWFPRSYWEMRDATSKTEPMYEPLWALHLIFPDIYPWSSIWTAQDLMRSVTDNAVYTWEQAVAKAVEAGERPDQALAQRIKTEVMEKFHHDGDLALHQYYCDVIKKIVMPPFEGLVFPACKQLLDPLNSAIPDPLKEFIDINKMFEDLVNSIIDSSIETVVRSG